MRHFAVGPRNSDLAGWQAEIDHMTNVLVGRVDPPMENGVMTLMEVASAYHARASEITMQIQRDESDGTVLKGSATYKFRTGELRTFLEMAKLAVELGSRRITQARLEAYDQ